MKIIVGLFLLIWLLPVHVWAATFYVSPTGNNANDCTAAQTISTPKLTFASVLPCVAAGDTLYIRAGTWTEQLDLQTATVAGTSDNYVTIAGYPGETVTLQYTDSAVDLYGPIKARGTPAYLIFDNLILDGVNGTNRSGWQIRDGNHHFILRNLEIKNFHYNGVYISADNVTVEDCIIHDQVSVSGAAGERWYGLYVHDGNNIVVQRNQVYGNPGGGVHVYPGPIADLVIHRNDIHENNTLSSSNVEGILVYEESATPITNVQIYNNLVYLNSTTGSGGTAGGIRVSNGPNATKVWNNTIYGNNGWGVNVQAGSSPPTSTVIQNNIVLANTSGQIVDAGTSSTIDSNHSTGTITDCTVSTSNFALIAGSDCADAGTTLATVTEDYIGTARPQGSAYDIGAREYVVVDSGGGHSTTPAWTSPRRSPLWRR